MSVEAIQIGLDSFYYAELLTDTTAGATYDTPVAIPGTVAATVKANGTIDTFYADDGPVINTSSIGRQEIDLEFTNLPLAMRAFLLGQTVTSGVIQESTTDTPKTVAIGFRSLKSDGAYRYMWYTKGNFTVPDDSFKTKEDKASFNTQKIMFSGLRRDYDGLYKYAADDDDAAVASATITNWFAAVPTSVAAPSALTLSVAPADGASSAAITANVVFTYNNALADNQLTNDFFYLMETVSGVKVSASLTIDTAKKVVTLNPDADLTASSTAYTAVASGLVKDVYGQKLAAGNTIINFATIA